MGTLATRGGENLDSPVNERAIDRKLPRAEATDDHVVWESVGADHAASSGVVAEVNHDFERLDCSIVAVWVVF